MQLVCGEVNLDVWGALMESKDKNSAHEIYFSISSVKMGPRRCERATCNRLMWPKRSRLSDWAPLFICGLIALLSTSHRCAVCAQIIALCEAKLASRELLLKLKSSLGTEWPPRQSRLGTRKKKFYSANSAKSLIGTNHVPLKKHWNSQENKVNVLTGSSQSSISYKNPGGKAGKGFSRCVTQAASDAHSQVRINLYLIFYLLNEESKG